ncbi:lysophospholipase L1-like esterase [Geodermatophilus tzadiensis]|uniref:Lysophospholipase L1-like esterase n=1 Tax=Geodermatophilus tzadiensis TaxID=1137988 RepID=A0A2T0TSY4_9ACTN|nr:GDSL-type esterase/lipase family protein [Geodermatophilus tzadiensis]PRY48638.1 lysophospholipase L1-like esterase [Geodermatophilus tzadiensis]
MRRQLVVGLAALLPLVAAAPAVAEESSPLGSPVYLALGDSVPAGVGAVPKVSGYPELLEDLLDADYNPAADKATGRSLADFQLENRAVAGATTATLISDQLPGALALITERNGDRDPKNDVEVITVTIGGNDVFGPVTAACITTATPTGCQATVEAALAGVRERLAEILGKLVAAAGRDTEVVVTTYYNPIGSCFLTGLNRLAPAIADVVLEGGAVPDVLSLSLQAGLNDVIRQVAANTGAQVTDLYGALDPSEYVGGRDCLHPNAAGHVTIAEELYATLAR